MTDILVAFALFTAALLLGIGGSVWLHSVLQRFSKSGFGVGGVSPTEYLVCTMQTAASLTVLFTAINLLIS